MATKRKAKPNTAGLLRPKRMWLATLAGLLLTVTGSGGQEPRLTPPLKTLLKQKGNDPKNVQIISYDEAFLEISNEALNGDCDLVIQPLDPTQVARMDMGMTNVTKGPRSGYRMLPHGTKFKKKIKISLPYDKNAILPGSSPDDIRTFFYDEAARGWVSLPLAGIDKVACTVTSFTDHFTDFVNATVTVPDHQGLSVFSPTELKNISAADPGAEISLIDPPQPNSLGSTSLTYPIVLPPGRRGVHPSVAVSYNSTSGNGWMGLGWNVTSSSVTVDTHWGVPRYLPDVESETYSLGGDSLTPLAHREDFKPRELEKTFHYRVEGRFDRIVRHGDHPLRYWWEVTDKNGIRRFYGGDPTVNGPAEDSILSGPQGIFQWALREVRDPNGNFVRYHYAKIQDPGMVNGQVSGEDLYLKSITYTGSGSQEGPYQVTFIRDRELGEARRPDVMIDCRGGFKRVTADILRRVDVSLSGSRIRRYEFRYQEGAFRKTILNAIIQYGEDGTTEFNRHTFDYFDEVRDQGGAYQGFGASTNWDSGNDHVTGGLLGSGQASALGGSNGNRIGGHLYVGWNFDGPNKDGSFGFKIGYNRTTGDGVLTLTDVDGDGLPDKVFRNDHGTFYRSNQSGPNGTTTFGPAQPLPTLSSISQDTSTTWSFGVEAYPFENVFTNFAQTFTHGTAYLSDVNGDGFMDLVKDGQVKFGYLDAQGNPAFTADSSQTPVPVGPGAVDATELIEDFEAIYQQNLDKYPLQDTLRRWVAPFDGTISILAPVALLQDQSPARLQYLTADGVRTAIQLNGAELWATSIGATDYDPKTPTGVEGIPVQKGDRIYFRVQSVFDGSYDQVSWNPEITYLNVTAQNDVNGLNPYRAKASEDFTFAGRPGVFVKVPLNGTVRLTGNLVKKAATTDDVTLVITQNGTSVLTQTLPAGQAGTITVKQDIAVTKQNILQLRVKVDSPIDISQIQWAPSLFYINSPDVATVTDDQGNYLLQLNPPYDIDFYPLDDLSAPQEKWTATQTGTLTVVPNLTANGNASGSVTFTVKKPGQLLAKQTLTIQNGTVQTPSITLDVTAGDVLYFDYSSYSPSLKDQLANKTVSVYFTNPDNSIVVPSAFHSESKPGIFPGAYRGWSVIGYNGNRDRATLPVDESLLVLNGQYSFENARAYPFNPYSSTQKWRGPDDQGWVSSCQMSSTRLGIKYIQVPRPNDFAGARGVTRLSRSQQVTVGGGIFLFSGSHTVPETGKGEALVDFIDMNGDRFPDIVSKGRIQYTTPTGGLEGSNRVVPGFGDGKIKKTNDLQGNLGVGGSPAMFTTSSKGNNGAAKGTDTGSQLPSLGLSGSLGAGETEVQEDLIDVNGDGLPDRVFLDGNQCMVRLNLGYSFAAAEPWPDSVISKGKSLNATIGGSIGFNDGIYGWGGGVSLSKNDSDQSHFWADVNGDGLIDKLRLSGNDLFVGFNTGNGFAPDVLWSSGVNSGLLHNGNVTLGGGFYFTIGISIFEVGYIIINPGFDVEASMARPESMIRDIDGDGFADYLVSASDGTLKVSRNLTGKTNLLKAVHRPLGASISIDYARLGNTRQDPTSHWVLSRTEVDDGHPGDGVDVLVTTFKYQDGRHDRLEREFLGFATVTAEQRDSSHGEALYRSHVQVFRNDSIYTKGLLVLERTQDAGGHVFFETETTYLLRDVATSLTPANPASLTASIFSMSVRTDQRFYEGQAAAQKSTYILHEYDSLGNVTKFVNSGDTGAQDDLEARLTYSNFVGPYIVGKPQAVQVFGNGALQRRREATIDAATGNMTQVRQYLDDGTFAISDVEYFPNGNLKAVTGPANYRGQRYRIDYEYDAIVASHIVRISDSFGCSSTAEYTLKYAKPTSVVDTNANELRRSYDFFGRLASATSPYEIGGTTATIRCEYHPEATVPWAHTRHLDSYRDANDPIETVVFTDGLKRVLQVKKDSTVHVAPGVQASDVMNISGRVTFDLVGRPFEQRYPTTEPLGTAGTYNPAVDPVNPTVTVFDVLDRKTKITIPDGTFSTMDYGFGADRDGVLQFSTTTTDANGNRSITYHDVRGIMTALKEFNVQKGQVIWSSYGYDALRQLVQYVDDRGNTTTSDYDFFGRRVSIDSPDKGKTVETYDLVGNVLTRVTSNLRAQNKSIAYQYDFDRLVGITYPNFPANNVTFEYGVPGAPFNRAGRVQKIVDASGTLQKFYGKLGEVVKEVRFVPIDVSSSNDADRTFTTQYLYDSFNRLQRMTYPDGEVLSYFYDSGGMLRAAQGVLGTQTKSYIARLEYDKFSNNAFLAFGNGITTSYSYNPLNRRLATMAAAQPGKAPFQNLNYGYDAVGNILQIQSQVPVPSNAMGGPTTQTFQYDSLYQLTHAAGSLSGDLNGLKTSTYVLDMDYDSLHNIVKKSQDCRVNGKVDPTKSYVLNYQYDGPQPHAPTVIGKRTFTYDADGNQASYDGKDDFGGNGTVQRNQVWDEEDRLVSAGSPGNGNTASFVYDQAGQRVIKRSSGQELAYVNPYFTVRNSDHKFLMTKHIIAGSTRIAATAFTGSLTAPHQEAFLFFYHGDHLGSANYLSDGAAQLRQHIEYFPFGEPWVTQSRDNSDIVNENPYLFTGKEYDNETSLYYFGARYFDPRTSVWQNADPLLSSFNRWTVNQFGHYAYASHNPVTRVDPNGLQDGTKKNGETVDTRTGKEAHVEFAEQKGRSRRVGLEEHGPITDSFTETKNKVIVRELKPATRLENPYKMNQAVDQLTVQGEAAAEEFAGKAIQAELWSWSRRASGSFLFRFVRRVPIAKAIPFAVAGYVAYKSGDAEAAVVAGVEAADPTMITTVGHEFIDMTTELTMPFLTRIDRYTRMTPEQLVDNEMMKEQEDEALMDFGIQRKQWTYQKDPSWMDLLNFDRMTENMR